MRRSLAEKRGTCTSPSVTERVARSLALMARKLFWEWLSVAGRVHAIHAEKRSKPVLQKHVREHIEAGSAIFTDALKSYDGLTEFEHSVVDHAVEYVNGNCR